MTQNLKHTVDLECSDNSRPSKISKIEYPSDSDIDEEEEGMSQNPRNGIQRYLVAIEYIGTLFSGSQKQLNVRTVVGALEVTSDHHFISIHNCNLISCCIVGSFFQICWPTGLCVLFKSNCEYHKQFTIYNFQYNI